MKQVTINGGNCYLIAAQFLGDASQFYRIMQQNTLSDPVLTGLVTLTIPDPDPTLTDGLPSQ